MRQACYLKNLKVLLSYQHETGMLPQKSQSAAVVLAEPRMLTATAAASTGWTEAVAKPEETSGPTSFGSGIP